MIIKKPPKKETTRSRAQQINDLVDYIKEPHRVNPEEKIEYAGAKNFLSEKHNSQKLEMISSALQSKHSKMPVSHWIMSWHEDEHPTYDQIDQCVEIFLEGMGLEGHQVVYGLHKDTKVQHLHIAVNRMNEETGKVVEVNKGFDREAAHKVIAKIEAVQGWRPEKNSRYTMLENGDIVRANRQREKEFKPKSKASDFEHARGEKSAQRIVHERGREILLSAKTWKELHGELAKVELKLEKKGSGAIIWAGDTAIKASSVDRKFSMGNLVKRLGNFEPGNYDIIPQRIVEPVSQVNLEEWKEYQETFTPNLREAEEARKEKAAQRKIKKQGNDILSSAKTWQELHEKLAKVELKLEKKGSGLIIWAGNIAVKASSVDRKFSMGNLTKRLGEFEAEKSEDSPQKIAENVPQVALEKSEESEKKQAASEKKKESENGRKQRRKYKPYPEIPRPLSEQRMRRLSTCHMAQNGKRTSDILQADARTRGRTVNALRWKIHQPRVKKPPRFVTWLKNTGKEKKADLWRHRSLFEEKKIVLEPSISEAYSGTENEIFEKYADAVQADRFRVTCIKMLNNGEKKGFILGKNEGVTQGFTKEETLQRMGEIVRIQARDENIYFTPLSHDKHHILIDDMNEESLKKFWEDGYRPAIILRSSPGNFQCVLTIKKLGNEFDRDVGNRLAERLNREYGDKKLSGCIHPHRAPGFENRKPKHRREDGQYPKVKLLYAARRECVKTLKLSEEIAREIELAAKAQRERRKKEEKERRSMARPGSPIAAYHAHLANIRRHLAVDDASRVDSMIALRMRATGHDQGAIEEAIRACAREMRGTEERRDWNRYAERTAAYAFSVAGDHSLERHRNYVAHWKRIEGIEDNETEQTQAARQRMRLR